MMEWLGGSGSWLGGGLGGWFKVKGDDVKGSDWAKVKGDSWAKSKGPGWMAIEKKVRKSRGEKVIRKVGPKAKAK